MIDKRIKWAYVIFAEVKNQGLQLEESERLFIKWSGGRRGRGGWKRREKGGWEEGD